VKKTDEKNLGNCFVFFKKFFEIFFFPTGNSEVYFKNYIFLGF